LWGLKGYFYKGYGGSITIGFDNGQFFFRVGGGVGLGAGIKYYPDAGFPVPSDGSSCGPRGFMGASGSVSASLGPASVELRGQVGWVISMGPDGKPRVEYIEEGGLNASLVGKAGWGLSLGGGLNLVDVGVAF
jgi:hypothetical protein